MTMKHLTTILALAYAALWATCVHAQATQPARSPAFIVGVWEQPFEDRDTANKWLGRGINTAVDVPGNHDPVAWSAGCVSAGLSQIRPPMGSGGADSTTPGLIAWMHADEPDLHGVPVATLAANRAAMRKANPLMPVLANFDGSRVLGFQRGYSDADYVAACGSADWIGSDIYPVTGWGDANLGLITLDSGSRSVAKLAGVSGGKRQLAFIECADAQLSFIPNHRCATPGEQRAETWAAVIRGASGIVYFSQILGSGWIGFDGTPPANAIEMTLTNEALTRYGDVLALPPVGLVVPAPLIGTQRGEWSFVLNNSAAAVRFGGLTYPPYGVAAFRGDVLAEQWPKPSPR
jgi:hypothetical protein